MTSERDRERDKVSVHDSGPLVGPITYTRGTGSLFAPVITMSCRKGSLLQLSEEDKVWSPHGNSMLFSGVRFLIHRSICANSSCSSLVPPPVTILLLHDPTDPYMFFRKKFIYDVTYYILVIL